MNDKIILLAGQNPDCRRIGISKIYAERFLQSASDACTQAVPEFQYIFSCGPSDEIAKSIQQGYLDIAVFVDNGDQFQTLECSWIEPIVWACAPGFVPRPGSPLPLIGTANGPIDQLTAQILFDANVRYEMTLVSSDWSSRHAAALAGLGYIFLPRRVVPKGLRIASEAYLPALPDLTCGIHVSPHTDRKKVKSLVAGLAHVFMPSKSKLKLEAGLPMKAEAI